MKDLCYVRIPGNLPEESVGIVRKGQSGYYQSDVQIPKTFTTVQIQAVVDELNAEAGISKAYAESMMVGSMFGWEVPGADLAMGRVRKSHPMLDN